VKNLTTKKRVKSALKPLKTAGNCISTNPKFNFSGGREGPRIPKLGRTALVKGLW